MSPPGQRQRLMQVFLDELVENARAIRHAADVYAGTQDPDTRRARAQEIYRSVHTLKGAARAVDVAEIQRCCHLLEDRLTGAPSHGAPLDVPLFHAAADALLDAEVRLRSGQPVAEGPLQVVFQRLAGPPVHSQATPAPLRPADPAPSPRSAPGGAARVPLERIDALSSTIQDLAVVRRRLEGHRGVLAEIQLQAQRTGAGWRTVQPPVRRLLRRARRSDPHGVRRAWEKALAQTTERLQDLERDLDRLLWGWSDDLRALTQSTGVLEDQLRVLRMTSFGDVCAGFDETVSRMATDSGKSVRLTWVGAETPVPRTLVDDLRDALSHLVRNAIDHGVEPPLARLQSGKPEAGTVTLRAQILGPELVVTVADDGRGFDARALSEAAAALGRHVPTDETARIALAFVPGLSTAKAITAYSGRGIGLDIVRTRIEAAGGALTLRSEPRRGTTFDIRLPRGIVPTALLLVRAGHQLFALPEDVVVRALPVEPEAIRWADSGPEVLLSEGWTPLQGLHELLDLTPSRVDRGPAVLIRLEPGHVVLLVDEIVDRISLVLQDLRPRVRWPGVHGAVVLPTGVVAWVLDVAALRQGAPEDALPERPDARLPLRTESRRILVADDSVTTRTLLAAILEGEGFQLRLAEDGQEAWRILQEEAVDLVVTDVEMPLMDGVALTRAVRASRALRHVPVVVITALQSAADRARVLDAGADAFLSKDTFDQAHLCATIRDLLAPNRSASPHPPDGRRP